MPSGKSLKDFVKIILCKKPSGKSLKDFVKIILCKNLILIIMTFNIFFKIIDNFFIITY